MGTSKSGADRYPGRLGNARGTRLPLPALRRGRLFAGLLRVRPTCAICGLDLSTQDAGDGPAVFVILFLGLIVVGLAGFVEIRFHPRSGSTWCCGRR
jgi:uncharacterized protein (DUF983 family)